MCLFLLICFLVCLFFHLWVFLSICKPMSVSVLACGYPVSLYLPVSVSLCLSRGVQYVHWVMHKCIMVKVRGKNTHNICKKQVNLPKTEGEIWKRRGGK